MNAVSLIIVAAGRSTRMGDIDKQFALLGGKPLLQYSIEAFLAVPEVAEIIVVLSEHNLVRGERLLQDVCGKRLPYRVVLGGATRQDSALAGFFATNPAFSWVAIHDGARPLVQIEQIHAVLAAAKNVGAAILGVPVKDTLKRASRDRNSSHLVTTRTVRREHLFAIQTPQVFERKRYQQAMNFLRTTQEEFTDDAAILEHLGHPVQLVLGEERNLKVTTPPDLALAEYFLSHTSSPSRTENASSPLSPHSHEERNLPSQPPLLPHLRVGQGYDVHRLVAGRPLVLGGVTVPHSMGLLGHSDADVLVHAVMDALLGAAALGDIGRHFPDTDEQYRNKNSLHLLAHVIHLLTENGYHIANIDATIVAQAPKLAPFLPEMVENIARTCNILPEQVNLKATTEEHLGFTGAKQGISATAVALLHHLPQNHAE